MGCSHPYPHHLGPSCEAWQEAAIRTSALRWINYRGEVDHLGYLSGVEAPRVSTSRPGGPIDVFLRDDAWESATEGGGWDGRDEDGWDLWEHDPMSAVAPRRWPLAPLLTYLRLKPTGFARRYGIPAQEVYDARDHGLTDDQADDWTIAADLHPALIWPDWLTALAADDEDQGDEADEWGAAA